MNQRFCQRTYQSRKLSLTGGLQCKQCAGLLDEDLGLSKHHFGLERWKDRFRMRFNFVCFVLQAENTNFSSQDSQRQLKRKFHTFSRLFQTSNSTFSKPKQWHLTPKITKNVQQTSAFLYISNTTSFCLTKKRLFQRELLLGIHYYFFSQHLQQDFQNTLKNRLLVLWEEVVKTFVFNIFVFDLSCKEDKLVLLLLPNKLPGSALDWLRRAKQSLVLGLGGGGGGEEKRRTRKEETKFLINLSCFSDKDGTIIWRDKVFWQSKKCYSRKSPAFSKTWLSPECSTPAKNPFCMIDRQAVTDQRLLFNFERSVLTRARPFRSSTVPAGAGRSNVDRTCFARDLTRIAGAWCSVHDLSWGVGLPVSTAMRKASKQNRERHALRTLPTLPSKRKKKKKRRATETRACFVFEWERRD